MGVALAFAKVFFFMSLLASVTNAGYKVFNVMKYGASSSGNTQSSEAFLRAWNDACRWNGNSMVLIPRGQYLVDSMLFMGQCKGKIVFYLRGTLRSPTNPKDNDQWITFRYVERLTVTGGGILDGEGYKVWHKNDCHINPNCQPLPTSMRLEFVKEGYIHHIRSVNSRNAHFSLYGCTNINMTNLRLSAPYDSPNTDGIKIGMSRQVRISHTTIGTGDDCVAIISGSKNVHVFKVFCGPGHGISVGSMGKYPDVDIISKVTVKNCTFKDTSDGLRIKTWSTPNSGFASNFLYEHIEMRNVSNPIVIDQQYCPHPPCDQKTPSHIQISNITYNKIWGISKERVAVTLNCSQSFPCKNIRMTDINLLHNGGSSSSTCSYANGASYGRQRPPSCL